MISLQIVKVRNVMQDKKYSESKTDQVKEDCNNSVLFQDLKTKLYIRGKIYFVS